MTPLRQKMIDLMVFGQFAPKTNQIYLRAVTQLSTYYHRLPEQISVEEVKSWLMETAAKRKWSACSKVPISRANCSELPEPMRSTRYLIK